VDCNWSKPLPILQLNQIGLVLFGLVASKDWSGLVSTATFTVNKFYYGSNYIMLQAGA
jgi:hypothetical protein